MSLSCILALAVLAHPAAQESRPAAAGVPALHPALTPADRLEEAWWKERFEAANARIARGDVELLFLGDSITQGWEEEGRAVWDEFYGQYRAVNLGFSGDRTQHVLWRLEHHGLAALAKPEPEKSAPRLAVLMIGTNNSDGNYNTAEEIAEGIQAIVESLRAKLPRTKVLLLAIFPRGEKPDAQRDKNSRASALASKLADGKLVHYLDIGPQFLEPDGTLSKLVMPDLLHLSTEGYGIWAEAIEAKVKELLAEG